MTGPVLQTTAQTEFRKAASVTMTGFALKDGHRAVFAISADRDGRCTGTSTEQGQGPSRFLRIKEETFVRLDPQAFVRQWGAAVATRYGERWVRLSPGQELEDVGGFCDLTKVPVVGAPNPAEQARSGGGITVGGRKAASFLVTSPDNPPYLGYIAAEGSPRPVRVESQAYDFQIDFSNYGLPVLVTAPPSDQVVDLSALTEQAP
ncbi:hypothetical protein OH807_01040 [Kitasatospora sp. NBC_01560]|uniref:hypothetical protein n=1 Tax=Kitasatospora sp. NBC_01560 TaxID=2975965 RepID=UPI00386C6859